MVDTRQDISCIVGMNALAMSPLDRLNSTRRRDADASDSVRQGRNGSQ